MYCPSCSHENQPNARFCGKCGAAMSAPQPPVHTSSGGTGGPTGSGDPVNNGLKYGVMIGSVFIPVLGIILGIIFMNDAQPQKKAVGKLWLWVGIGAMVVWCILSAMSGFLADTADW